MPKIIEIDKEKAIRLYKKGLSLVQVALSLDVSPSTIKRRFKDWGVEMRKGRGNTKFFDWRKRI